MWSAAIMNMPAKPVSHGHNEQNTAKLATDHIAPKPHSVSFDWDEVLAEHLSLPQRAALKAARVGIAGAGGLGSNVACMLARSGIGHLVVADHDMVCLSNLNRQAFGPEHLDQPKAFALRDILLQIRPGIDVDARLLRLTAANIHETFKTCDIVIEAVDDPALKRTLIEALLESGHTVIAASGMAGWGGPPMKRRDMGSLIVTGDFINEISLTRPPMAPRVIMAAAMQADAVLSLILGENSAL